MKRNVREGIKKAIRQYAGNKAALVTAFIYNKLQLATPVITGETRRSWFIDVDGDRYYEVPPYDVLMRASMIKIRNDESHIGELEEKYGLVTFTAMEVEDFAEALKKKRQRT